MIKLEHTEVVGWEAAIRGMRNPMNSWDKSDSRYSCLCMDDKRDCPVEPYIVGPKDYNLMMNLRNAGTDHRKFMRMIVVYLDITAPLYWWKEFKTYRAGRRFGDDEPDIIDAGYLECDIETNSCSTMHKIHENEFTYDDFSIEHVGDVPNCDPMYDGVFDYIITVLNESRHCYLDTKDKKYWWQMIQLLPSSYNQKRTVMLNYEVLANIYKSRKNHKLDEWIDFCKWIEGLPYPELITGASLKDMPICNEIMEEAKRRVTNEED